MPADSRSPRFLVLRAVIVAALAAACGAAAIAQTAAPASADLLARVHPDLREAVASLAQGKFPARAPDSVSAPPSVQRMVPGPPGAPDVRVHVINGGPANASRPAILHMHGGGYTMGTATPSAQLRSLAAALDCVIVTADYRLAPGTPYPGSLEDNYAALKWLHRHAGEVGADPARIAVMGESAGGGHAAMLALAARDRREVPLIYQVLIYPMLDDRTGSTRQMPPHIGTLVWTAHANRQGWTALLGKPAGAADVPNGAVPARAANLAGLPPAYIAVGDLDLFVDEDIAYAQRLIAAGVSVELSVIAGAFHGFDVVVPDAPLSKRFGNSTADVLRRAFQHGRAAR